MFGRLFGRKRRPRDPAAERPASRFEPLVSGLATSTPVDGPDQRDAQLEPPRGNATPHVAARGGVQGRALRYEPMAHDNWAELAAQPAAPGDALPEERQVVAITAAEHAVIIDLMRVAPDVRYRAARSLDLLRGLEDTYGFTREHAIIERARDAGQLIPLTKAIAR
jgi:hypothetical protein